MKKLISTAVIAALAITAPGADFYQALAAMRAPKVPLTKGNIGGLGAPLNAQLVGPQAGSAVQNTSLEIPENLQSPKLPVVEQVGKDIQKRGEAVVEVLAPIEKDSGSDSSSLQEAAGNAFAVLNGEEIKPKDALTHVRSVSKPRSRKSQKMSKKSQKMSAREESKSSKEQKESSYSEYSEKINGNEVSQEVPEPIWLQKPSLWSLSYGMDADLNAVREGRFVSGPFLDIGLFISAKLGDTQSQFLLGAAFLEVKNFTNASLWMRRAAEKHQAEAQLILYQFREDLKIDWAEAVKWLKESAEGGNAEAQFALGSLLENPGRNFFKAVILMQVLTGGRGLDDVRFSMSELHRKMLAYKWYALSAGQTAGQVLLRKNRGMLMDGKRQLWLLKEPLIKRLEEARKAIKRLEGSMYEDAVKDAKESVYIYLIKKFIPVASGISWHMDRNWRSADSVSDPLEESSVQRKLGYLYLNNLQGTEQPPLEMFTVRTYWGGSRIDLDSENCKEALKWLVRAAIQADAPAMLTLGLMYRYGYGVTLDSVEALKWSVLAERFFGAREPESLSDLARGLRLNSPITIREAARRADNFLKGHNARNWKVFEEHNTNRWKDRQ